MTNESSIHQIHINSNDLRCCRVIQHSIDGYSGYKIAVMLLVSAATVYRWLKEYKEKGEQALEPEKRGRKMGTGRLLTLQQEEQIQHMISNNFPVDFDLNYSVWSRKAIAELAENKFGIHLAIRTMGDYLKRWSFSHKNQQKSLSEG